ncbi:nucleoprotein [Quaranjavirus johnstonense]|uniref:Nucleoprotein n=1 Tax=Quaranjavirus johnstonense TaxID=688437 RepID=A0A6B9XDM4_9ORTO|nr:nucleoprotein [Quaranjavirus johnstonense]QHR77127.1 nucleoprotein [Quaranjavirus johnstonense]
MSAPTGVMDIDQASTSSKPTRKRINNSGEEIGAGGKRALTGLSTNQKVSIHRAIASMVYRVIVGIFGFTPLEVVTDVNVGVYAMNQVWSIHNYFRTKNNKGRSSILSKIDDATTAYQFTLHGKTITVVKEELKKVYRDCISAYFEWSNMSEWMGSVHTIMALWNLFGARLNEIRIMPSANTISVEKDNKVTVVKDFNQYGIPSGMRHFATGADFKPTMKSALAQSMGPVTTIVQLSEATDNQYAGKWVDAFKRAFSHIPHIDQIAKFMLMSKPAALTKINGYLMAIAGYTGTREQKRIAFPPGTLSFLMHDLNEKKEWVFNESRCTKFDFSGTGAYRMYMHFLAVTKANPLKMNVADPGKARQILFHAMFGTHVEDFGILQSITDVSEWHKRKDFETEFKTIRASNARVEGTFYPIDLRYYSKVCSSLNTRMIGGGSAPITNCQIFSGNRKRIVTEGLKSLGQQGMNSSLATLDKDSIEKMLREHLETIRGTFTDGYDAGTVNWRKFEGLTWDKEGEEVEMRPSEIGVIYWSN